MTDIRTHDPELYNKHLAEALKKSDSFKKPEWIAYVKTGAAKNRPNTDPDFWYKRAASILRQLYTHGIVGVGRMRTRYGGRKDRGMQPPKFVKSGGKVIRMILQQAEAAGFVEKVKSTRSGRQLTVKGREFLEEIKI